jgi:tetratricopeptide (TPR) repeat protein
MRVLFFTVNTLALLVLASASKAQDAAWQRAYDSAKQAFAEHRYSDADKAYQAALARAEDFEPGDLRLSATLFGLGIDYYVERRYEEAEPLLLRVVELREARANPDSDLAKALLQLAELYRATHHLRKAESLYRKTLAVCNDLPSPDSVTTATVYLDLGLMYTEQDLPQDAETAYVQAISKFQNAEGAARTGLGFSNLNLAQIYEVQNKFAQADPLYQQAIAAFEQSSGPNSLNLASALDGYARLLKKMDREAEASKAQKRADQIRRKSGS